jgi:hypothetical protein
MTHGGTTMVGRTLVETWITAACTAPSRPSATARAVMEGSLGSGSQTRAATPEDPGVGVVGSTGSGGMRDDLG